MQGVGLQSCKRGIAAPHKPPEDPVGNRLYVGNLPYSMGEQQLRDAFGAYGEVTGASVVLDRETGRSRGFGFVEMATALMAQKATEALNGQMVDGRALTVNEARERGAGGPGGPPRGPRSFDRPAGGFSDRPPPRGGGYADRGPPAGFADAAPATPDRSQQRRERDRSDRGERDERGGGSDRGGRGSKDRW